MAASSGRSYIIATTDNGESVINSDGQILVIDRNDNKAVYVDVTPEIQNMLTKVGLSLPESTVYVGQESSPHMVAGASASTEQKKQEKILSQQVAQWDTPQEQALIAAYKEHRHGFADNTMKSDDVWTMINQKIINEGYAHTVKQVKDKYKNLRRAYMAYTDSMGPKKSGGEPQKEPKHLKELDEIFKKSPQVQPVTITSSRRFNTIVDEPDNECDDVPTQKIVKQDKNTKLEKQLGGWAKCLQSQMKENEAKRQERYTDMLSTYSRMADAQERAAASFEAFTNFMMKKRPLE